jgi:hypothetical protein
MFLIFTGPVTSLISVILLFDGIYPELYVQSPYLQGRFYDLRSYFRTAMPVAIHDNIWILRLLSRTRFRPENIFWNTDE